MDERNAIHRGRLEGQSLRTIARTLGRPVSAVSREVERTGSGAGYDALSAPYRATGRRRPGRRKLAPGTPLWRPVVMDLYRGGSPEHIAGRRRAMHPEEPGQWGSHETIYLALYALPRGELRKALLGQLRHSHTARRPRSRGQDRRGGLRNMTSIHDRPAAVATREVPGPWEGELITGAGTRSTGGTLGERTSCYVIRARMDGTGAAAALDALAGTFGGSRPASARP